MISSTGHFGPKLQLLGMLLL